MSTLLQDVRYGLRMLLRTPVVTAVAGLSLAIGISVNAASFALVEGFLLAPLPYEDQETLVFVWHQNLGRDVDQSGIPAGNYLDMRREASDVFSSLAAYQDGTANLTGLDRPEQIRVMTVTPDFFGTLGVQPARGRDFRPEEGVAGQDRVAILHHDYWSERLASDPGVLGRTLVIDGTAHIVIGVMPEDFDPIPADADLFRPSDFRDRADVRGGIGLLVVGRLAPGADVEAAQRSTAALQASFVAAHPDELEGWSVRVQPMRETMPGPTDTRLVLILTAVTLFGLVIACANVANLLLARAESRQKEIAVRTAMGAQPGRILRQLLTESVVLAVLAGAAGTAGSVWILRAFRGVFPPQVPDVFLPVLRPTTLAAVLAVTLGAGVLFGLAPALSVVRSDLRSVLGEGSRGGTAGRGRRRLRNAFVVGEFAVAVALLTGAAFLGRAFQQLVTMDTGFRAEGVLTASVSLPEDRYPDDASVAGFHVRVAEALRAVPGVREVAVMTSIPRARGTPAAAYEIEGRPPVPAPDRPRAIREVVSDGWFETLDVEVVEGRPLRASDRADAPPVAVVNRAFAEREFGAGDAVSAARGAAIGERVVVEGEPRTIVGVVEDILHARIPDPGEGPAAAIYLPLGQMPVRSAFLAVRGPGDPAALGAPVREAVWSVDPDQPLGSVQPLQSAIDASLAGPRVLALFLGVLAAVALALAAMGVYGVLAHTVALQRRELGIRMALGADRGSVLGMVTRNGLGLVGLGLLVGAPLAALMYLAASRTLAGLSEIAAPGTVFAAVAGTLGLVALAASLIPAVRATRVDPVRALSD